MPRKLCYQFAEFTNHNDGEKISLDPADCSAFKRAMDDEKQEDKVTNIYTYDGSYWQVDEGYVEVAQVLTAAITNNILLESEARNE